MPKPLIIFLLSFGALTPSGTAKQYSLQLLNYQTAAAYRTLRVPERGDLIFRGFGAEKIEFPHNRKINGLALARSFETRFLTEVSLEYQNLQIRLSGPDAYNISSVDYLT